MLYPQLWTLGFFTQGIICWVILFSHSLGPDDSPVLNELHCITENNNWVCVFMYVLHNHLSVCEGPTVGGCLFEWVALLINIFGFVLYTLMRVNSETEVKYDYITLKKMFSKITFLSVIHPHVISTNRAANGTWWLNKIWDQRTKLYYIALRMYLLVKV